MSRNRPHTPKAVTAAGPPPAGTCDGCRHWREQGEARGTRLGLCVVEPPSVQGVPTEYGNWRQYPVTGCECPACGKYEAK